MNRSRTNHIIALVRIICIYWVALIQHNALFGCSLCMYTDAKIHLGWTEFFTELTMPLCFSISGYLLCATDGLQKYTLSSFLFVKISRLLLPCWLFGLLVQLMMDHTVSMGVLWGAYHMWFIAYLFAMFLISFFAYRLKSENALSSLLFLLLLLSILLFGDHTLFVFSVAKVFIKYYFFFLLGYCAYSAFYHIFLKRSWNIILLMMVPLFIYAIHSGVKGDLIWFSYEILCTLLILYSAIRMGSSFAIGGDLFQTLDRTSFGVYIFHWFWSYLLQSMVVYKWGRDWMNDNILLMSSTIAVMSIVFSIPTTILFKRIGIKI